VSVAKPARHKPCKVCAASPTERALIESSLTEHSMSSNSIARRYQGFGRKHIGHHRDNCLELREETL